MLEVPVPVVVGRGMLRMAIVTWIAATFPVAAGERLTGRARVLDGDTIVVGGIAVRLKGVAAPEAAHFGSPGGPGGEEAKAYMVELVEKGTVVCDLTRERTHGRRAGYCYVDGQDVAEALTSAGLAWDCPRFSKGRYAKAERVEAPGLPFPSYCQPE